MVFVSSRLQFLSKTSDWFRKKNQVPAVQLQTNTKKIKTLVLWFLASFPSFFCFFSQFSDMFLVIVQQFILCICSLFSCLLDDSALLSFLLLLHSFLFSFFALFSPQLLILLQFDCLSASVFRLSFFLGLVLVSPWFPCVLTEGRVSAGISCHSGPSSYRLLCSLFWEVSFSNSLETSRNSPLLRCVQPPHRKMWSAVIVASTGNPESHAHEECLILHKIMNHCFAKNNLGCNYLTSPSDKSAIVVWFQLLSRSEEPGYLPFLPIFMLPSTWPPECQRTWLRRKSYFCRVCVWTWKTPHCSVEISLECEKW